MLVRQKGERFFFIGGLLLTAIVVAGFLPPAFLRPSGVLSVPLLYHVHGLVFLSWFLLFSCQAKLILGQNKSLHRRLGQSSLLVATAMIVLGYFMIRAAFSNPEFSIGGNGAVASTLYPVTDMVNFSIAFALGYVNRTNGVAHKRLMLLAGILILDPAIARLVETIGAPFPLIPIIELCLFASLIGYDFLKLGRPHWTSLLGLALFFLAMAAKLILAQHPLWADFAVFAFG
ncbi:MAG: hypothetical protein ACI9CE_000797 [Flavobacterium sp.]|jgi:hypothetical protein